MIINKIYFIYFQYKNNKFIYLILFFSNNIIKNKKYIKKNKKN